MKNSSKVVLFNLVFTILNYIIWSSSTETMVGGICNYWRCTNPFIFLIPILLLVQVIGNVIMWMLCSDFLLVGEDEDE